MLQTGPHLNANAGEACEEQPEPVAERLHRRDQHTHLAGHPGSQYGEAVHTGSDHVHGRVNDGR